MKVANRTKAYVIACCCATVVVAVCSAVGAVPLWDVDFGSMTVGQPPDVAAATPGVVNTQPTGLDVSGGNSILVQSSFTGGSATLSDQPVVFSHVDTSGSPMLTFHGAIEDYELGKTFQLEFDLLISSSNLAVNAPVFDVVMRRNGTGTPVAVFTLTSSGWGAMLTSSDNVNAPQSGTFNSAWAADQVMHVTLLYDPINGVFSAKIDESDVGSISLAQDFENQGVRQFYISASATSSTSAFAVDSIVNSTTEPDYSGEPDELPGGIVFGDDTLELCFEQAGGYFDLFSVKNTLNGAIYAGWRGKCQCGDVSSSHARFQWGAQAAQ